MTAPVPDRVCVDKESPFFDERYTQLGVKINGIDRKGDVYEFCVSERWARVQFNTHNGSPKLGRSGKVLTMRLTGTIEPYWRQSS